MSVITVCDGCGGRVEDDQRVVEREGQHFHDPGCWVPVQQAIAAAIADATAKIRKK